MAFVNGAVFGGGTEIAPAAEIDPNAFAGSPDIGSLSYGGSVQWITQSPGDSIPSGQIETVSTSAVFGGSQLVETGPVGVIVGGSQWVEQNNAVAYDDYVQGQSTQKPDYKEFKYPVETASVEKRIYDYAHSLAWGTPTADAVAVPKLAAMAKSQRWSNAQIAAALGFRESDIVDLWKRYKITFENTSAAVPAFGGTATIALAVAAAAALALGG